MAARRPARQAPHALKWREGRGTTRARSFLASLRVHHDGEVRPAENFVGLPGEVTRFHGREASQGVALQLAGIAERELGLVKRVGAAEQRLQLAEDPHLSKR